MREMGRSGACTPPRRREVPARSIDAVLLAQLGDGPREGTVHSVFLRTVNLRLDDDSLLSIAACDVDDAPQTAAVTRLSDLSVMGFVPGAAVRVTARRIEADGGPAVSLDGACAWAGGLAAYPGDRTVLRRNLVQAESRLASSLERRRRDRPDSPFDQALTAEVAARGAKLVQALAAGDVGAAATHARSLIGLGHGLTPSGDDFLLGLFTLFSVPGSPVRHWQPLARMLAREAYRATNLISSSALRLAAEGRVRESIGALVAALFSGDEVSVTVSLDRVLAIGSSSGADIASGLLAGCQLSLQIGGESCP